VPEWVVLQFAIAKAGAILVTANTSLRARDIDYLLRQSEAATLITIRGFRDVDYVNELAAIGATTGARTGATTGPRATATESAPLARRADSTLAEQLAARYAQRIRERALAAGARLPSVRECARRHAVSPHIVVAAYDQLLAQGLVEARRQRGFFVRDRGTGDDADGRGTVHRASGARPLPVSATTLIRGMFQPQGGKPMPGLGTLPADWLDLPLLAGALRKVSSGAQLGALSLQYGDPAGEPRLREALARKLADVGVDASPAQIVTTVGATHALDIVTRSLLRAGDAVLVDEPGWSVEYARLAALGLQVLPVPRGDDGPDLAAMERLIEGRPAH